MAAMHDRETGQAHPPTTRAPARRRKAAGAFSPTSALVAVAIAASTLPSAMAWNCVPLKGSTACPAFANASISTQLNAYPFLSTVSDVKTFDDELRAYANDGYARRQYLNRIGCSSVDLKNTTHMYARYTLSVLCNFIVQASINDCGLDEDASRPLCAPSCGEYAISEAEITASPELCGTPGTGAIDIIRADYQECSNPIQALTDTCIDAALNEPKECGYESNLPALCGFCGTSPPNATNFCCVAANVEKRCVGVHLPITSSMPPVFPTASSAPNATAGGAAASSEQHLSGGAIAGIVVGSVVGAAILLALLIFSCMHLRRRKNDKAVGILNSPSPPRQGPQMSYHDPAGPPTVVPGGRVARMSALETSSDHHSSRAGGGIAPRRGTHSAYTSSPDSGRSHLGGNLPKRDGSLSSNSVLVMNDDHSSPRSGTDRNFSSPEGMASGQSEQLQFFKDYYSQDEIRPNDTVAVLWAYQPRANDEFELERGDMLKVVGIWDDGWATGVKLSETAEQWEARKSLQRDSGVSNGGSSATKTEVDTEIKAFPMVCVCLPQHWRKTIEGDSTDTGGTGSGGEYNEPPSP